jgi:hypothetical protein
MTSYAGTNATKEKHMQRLTHNVLMLIVAVLVLNTSLARADGGFDTFLRFGPPMNPFPAVVLLNIQIWNGEGMGWGTIPVPPVIIPPGTPASVKRDLIQAALQAVTDPRIGAITPLPPAGLQVHLNTLRPIRVGFFPMGTGENPDYVECKGLDLGVTSYVGSFNPYDYQGQPAIFTAGIVTDVGELSVQVSAEELNFQTEGPIICQALFQRLAPHAPQYGAQINYAGDRLEVYFDPAYTVQSGGVIFGTTSTGQGASGQVEAPSQIVPGDVNCDGSVNFGDINVFVLTLTNPSGYADAYPDCDILSADINGDGSVNFADINPFVGLLTGGQ